MFELFYDEDGLDFIAKMMAEGCPMKPGTTRKSVRCPDDLAGVDRNLCVECWARWVKNYGKKIRKGTIKKEG